MDHNKKLDFIHKMAKLGLQHFDAGGGVLNTSANGLDPVAGAASGAIGNAIGGSNGATVNGLVNPVGGIVGNNPIMNPVAGIQQSLNTLSGATQQGTPGQQNPYVQSNATNPNTGIIGSIGGALGLNNNFQASSANVTPGTNAAQLGQAYTGAQNALAGQQSLANTLAPQAQTAVGNQNALAAQYAAMANGQGPNPAQNQLAQATGANVSNQAALMAGQRGSGSNIGLLTRQNAMQGAGIQQNAAGQAATLGSQQQIAAQNNLANLSNAQIGQTGQTATNLSSAAQGEQGILQNANTGFNNAIVGMQSNINNVNSQTAGQNANTASNILGGAMQGISSISSMFAEGGEVDQSPANLGTFSASPAGSDSGPSIPGTAAIPTPASNPLASSSGGKSGGGGGAGGLMSLAALLAKGGQVPREYFNNHISSYFADGGKVPAMVSPGEVRLSPEQLRKVVHGGANPLKIGERIGGKAKVKGDSYENDNVRRDLNEGDFIIDRENARDPKKAMAFIHSTLAKKGLSK